MNNIYCRCGNLFDKKAFKEHLRYCIYIKDIYKDVDYTIFCLIRKNNSINDLNIIKCLLESYIKIINILIKQINDEEKLDINGKLINNIEEIKIITNNGNDNNNNSFNNENKSRAKEDNDIMNDENNNKQSENEEYKNNIYSLSNNSIIENKKETMNKRRKLPNFTEIHYVEEITKKIFVLLYFNEQRIKKKLQKEIKDVYNFKNYYLINSDWLNEYKEFFQYEIIKTKLISQLNLNDKEYTYKQIKYNLDNIIKEIGKIIFFHKNEKDNNIKNGNNLIPKINKIILKNEDNEGKAVEHEGNDCLLIPYGFEIITDDIYELLLQEKFFILNDNIKNKIKYKLLIGNNQIILKNVIIDDEGNIINHINNYFFYIEKNKKINSLRENDWDKNDPFIIYYVLNYEKDKNVFKYLEYIYKEKGFKEFISRFDINKIYYQQNIEKNKNIGKFINIRINKEDIKNINGINETDKDLNIMQELGNISQKDNEDIIFKLKKNKEKLEKNKSDMNIEIIELKKNIKKNKNTLNIKENGINELNKKIEFINQKIEETNYIKKNQTNKINLFGLNGINNIEKENYNLNKNNLINFDNNSIMVEEINKYSILDNSKKENKKTKKYFEKFIKKKDCKLIENFFQETFSDIKNEKKEISQYIRYLDPDEILAYDNKSKNNNIHNIILMNESSFLGLGKYIKYKLISNFVNLDEKQKKIVSKNYIDEFNEILSIINNKIKLSELIKNYQDCLENLKHENKFYVIKSNYYIKQNSKIEEIKYFIYHSNNYILFKDNKKIFQIEKTNEDYWILIEYNRPKEIIKDDLIKIIQNEITTNKTKQNLRKYVNISKYKDIKDFYLINKDLLKKIISKNNFEIFNSINNFDEIPKYFGIIEKNQANESIIKKTNLQNKIFQYKIFFIDEYKQKSNNNNLYIGIINDTKYIINFYLLIKQNYSLEYIINYKNKDMMVNDIENNIIPKGIAVYIYETGIVFSNMKTNKLFNKKFELIGYITNLKNENYNLIDYQKNLQTFEGSFYYIALIQCLVNIKSLKDLFLNRELLLKEKIIQDNKKVIKSFYEIMKYMWDYNNSQGEKEFYSEFLYEIQALSHINNIGDKLDLLIEFLLYSMHIEQTINDEKIKINYDLNSIKYNIKDDEKSFIKNLFLFKLENQCKTCKNANHYQLILNINMKETININSEIIYININTIFNKNNTILCDLCSKPINNGKIEFKICPNILLIYFQEINIPNIRFIINEEIDLSDNISMDNKDEDKKYKLTGYIGENNENNKKIIMSYYKSLISGNWLLYKNGQLNFVLTEFNSRINNYKFPNLLIYERISK